MDARRKRTRRRRRGTQKGEGFGGLGRLIGAMSKAAATTIAKKATGAAARQLAKNIALKAAKGGAAAGGAYLTTKVLQKI